MDVNVAKNAESIIKDAGKLKEFADLNSLSVEAARNLLERLTREPELSAATENFISSADRSNDFKGYVAGEDKGYVRGHEAGFAKGSALGVLGTIGVMTLAGLAYLAKNR